MMNWSKFFEYEKTLSSEKKKSYGIVYTPHEVVDQINKEVLSRWNKTYPPRVVDRSCGTGIFLWDMAHKIAAHWKLSLEEVIEKNIYGCDIDEDAIKVAKEIFGTNSNFSVQSGLEFDHTLADCDIGNPPYVRIQNLDESTRKKVGEFSWCGGSTDLYIAFLQSGFINYETCGYVAPNSWLKNKAGKQMRQDVYESKRLNWIRDWGDKKIFKGVSAYCASIVFSEQNERYELNSESLRWSNRSESNFFYSEKQKLFLDEVAKRNTRLLDICDVRIGLATLADSIFFLPNGQVKGDKWVTDFIAVEFDVTKPCVKASKKSIGGRIIYPYDKNGKLINELTFKNKYPLAYKYLLGHKDKLLSRDKGKIDNNKWFSYGRKQGVYGAKEKLLLAPFQKESTIIGADHNALWISGYGIFPKNGASIEGLKDIFTSDEMERWYKIKGKPLSSGWRGVNKDTLSEYRINTSVCIGEELDKWYVCVV
tara:strand:+ start:716 stop:2152 length:1437 start_codon:yes stop_codon:yes gene_type:complete